MDKKWIAVIAIVVIAIVACGAYFMMGSDSDVVRIGHLPSDHDSAMYVAQAQKQYESQGLKVEFTEFNNGGDLMTAMASGDIDVGYLGITPVMSSIEKGVPVKVISGAQTEGSALVVAADSPIKSVKDLKGKTVATPGEASIQYMLLQYALENNGLKMKDVKSTSMKVSSMCDALNAGKVDAIMVYEPYASIATSQKYGKVLMDSGDIIPEHPCCVVAAREDFIKNHPNETKKILAIHENATNFVNENPSEAIKLLPKNIVANAEVQAKVLDEINFISGLDDDYKKSVMDFMQIEVKMGVLKQPLTEDQIFANI